MNEVKGDNEQTRIVNKKQYTVSLPGFGVLSISRNHHIPCTGCFRQFWDSVHQYNDISTEYE